MYGGILGSAKVYFGSEKVHFGSEKVVSDAPLGVVKLDQCYRTAGVY